MTGDVHVVEAYLCIRGRLTIDTRHVELEQEVFVRAGIRPIFSRHSSYALLE